MFIYKKIQKSISDISDVNCLEKMYLFRQIKEYDLSHISLIFLTINLRALQRIDRYTTQTVVEQMNSSFNYF